MFSVTFAFIISKIIKESFGFDSVVTDDKALILVSTYDGDRPYSTDIAVKQYIEDEGASGENDFENPGTIIQIKTQDGKNAGFVHIKTDMDLKTRERLSELIGLHFKHEVMRTEIELEHTDNEKLLQSILSEMTPETSKNIKNLASRLNYNIDHPMAAIVAQMEENRFLYFNMDMGYSAAIKATRERIIKEIRNHSSFNNRDIMAFTNEGYLVVLKAFFSMEDLATLYMQLHKNVEQIDAILGKYKIFKYLAANGPIVEHYSNARASYAEAIRNIEIAKMIGMKSSVVFPKDILFEKMIDNFPVETIEMEIMPLVKKISDSGIEKSIEMLSVFEKYCAFDFNISETAEKCYLHRNTVAQKLEKLKGITGLDPMGRFKDRLLLNLLYSYVKMYKPELK